MKKKKSKGWIARVKRQPDWVIIGAGIAAIGVGLVMIWKYPKPTEVFSSEQKVS